MKAFDPDLVSLLLLKQISDIITLQRGFALFDYWVGRFSSFLSSLLWVRSETACGKGSSCWRKLLNLGTTRMQWIRPVGWSTIILWFCAGKHFCTSQPGELPKQGWLWGQDPRGPSVHALVLQDRHFIQCAASLMPTVFSHPAELNLLLKRIPGDCSFY